jgi:phosphate transport system protein
MMAQQATFGRVPLLPIPVEERLQGLFDEVTELGALVGSMTHWAARTVLLGDRAAGERVLDLWPTVQGLQTSIHQSVVEALSTPLETTTDPQPLLAVSRLSRQLERIGGYATATAERHLAFTTHSRRPTLPLDLELLSGLAQVLLDDALTAFERRDPRLAETVTRLAEEVVLLHRELVTRLVGERRFEAEAVEQNAGAILAAQSFVRLADYARDIAEELVSGLGGSGLAPVSAQAPSASRLFSRSPTT